MLYQVNVRVLLSSLGEKATLDDISQEWLNGIAHAGFNWVYFLGIWQTGKAGVEFSERKMRQEGVLNRQICSSPFAITDYQVHTDFGGSDAYLRLKKRCESCQLKVMLDFVPNHLAVDHKWTVEKPSLLLQGTENDMKTQPQNYFKCKTHVFAHGRDPFYPGWRDTVQLNYFNAETQETMIDILEYISQIADGVRCDMAMLALSDVFMRTWGGVTATMDQFWEKAIQKIRNKVPEFLFIAEVYWDREYDLQQLGFDYTYDKTLYDRLVQNNGPGVASHLRADDDFQQKSVRFLENHDEPRAASTLGGIERHFAAATICFTIPGMKFIHHGQLQGRREFISMHVGNAVAEQNDGEILALYSRVWSLLRRPEFKHGTCVRALTAPSLDGNESFKSIVAHFVEYKHVLVLIVVNYSCGYSDGHVVFSRDLDRRWSFGGQDILLLDLFSSQNTFVRPGTQLVGQGMWFRLHPFQVHALKVIPLGAGDATFDLNLF